MTRITRRTSVSMLALTALLVVSCGSYDRNPPSARASTTTRARFGQLPTTSTTTTRPTNTTSTTRAGTTTTTQPGAPSSTASTTRPALNSADVLPPQLGRLAIIDALGRLVVTQPNGRSVVPIAAATQGEIAFPTWSPDASRLVWSATSPIGAQIATSAGAAVTAIALTEPAPTSYAWRPPRARSVLGAPQTTAPATTTPAVAWSRTIEDQSDLGAVDLAAASAPRTLVSGERVAYWLAPDGNRAIVHGGEAGLEVIDLDTGVSTPLSVTAAEFETPVWLENDLVLLGVQSGTNRFLSIVDVNTGRRQDLLRYEGTIQFVVDVTGQRIAYQVNASGGGGVNPVSQPRLQTPTTPPTTSVPTASIGRLGIFDRRNNTNRSILDSAALAFTWSPMSDRLAFLAQAGGAVQWRFWTERTIESSVLFQPSAAVQQYIQAFTQHEQSARWFSPDGRAFVFAGKVADLDGVWVQPLDGFGPPARVSEGSLGVWSPQ
jgi:hypothetical protein